MSSAPRNAKIWLLRTLGRLASKEFWQEELGAALLIAGAILILFLARGRSLPLQVALWAMLAMIVAYLWRRGWIKLFGPVLFYDLLRVGRRSRYILFRSLYALALLLLLSWVYWMWELNSSYTGRVQAMRMAEFTESFFYTFMVVQLLLVLLLTPAYLAGAIAEEKDRKTLEFLLATDLRSREIVLSKLLSRLANLALIVLAGLPILSATQFLGGVDPDLLLASFAALGLTMASLACLSILMSVHCRKPRDAIILTYLVAAAYPTLALIFLWFVLLNSKLALLPTDYGLFSLMDVAEVVNSGNLFFALYQLAETVAKGGKLADILPTVLRNYAIFHGAVALICTAWAVVRLRPVALKEAFGKVKKGSLGLRLFGRPGVGGHPMLWKEIFAESRLHFHWIGWVVVAMLVVVSFLPVYFIFEEWSSRSYYSYRDHLGQMMNVWARITGSIVATLMLLGVAVRAASSVSSERDKQTLDGLLTTPMDSNTILLAKWAGAVLSVRWAWLWLTAIFGLAVICGGVQVLTLPVLLGAWLVYAGTLAVVGLWYSAVSRTTLRATMWTLLTTLFLMGGHWMVSGMCCYAPLGFMGVRERDFEYLLKFQVGQTPPVVLGLFAIHGDEFEGGRSSTEFLEFLGFSLFGVATWAVAGLVMANVLAQRFGVLTNRRGTLAPRHTGPALGKGPQPNGAADVVDVLPVEDEALPLLREVEESGAPVEDIQLRRERPPPPP